MLSVVLPVCNEDPGTLSALLHAIHAVLEPRSQDHEILVVDDGSHAPVVVPADCAGYAGWPKRWWRECRSRWAILMC